jgi:hypothetical protein
MSTVELKKELASKLTKEQLIANGVTLVLGYAAKLVKQMLTGNYYTLTSAEDVHEFIGRFSIKSDQLVVFEDLALLDPRVQAYLLKFIEENYCPLLILSSRDSVLPTILSRCRVIIKVPAPVKSKNGSLPEFVEYIDQKLSDGENVSNSLVDDSLTTCPEYYYLVKKYLDTKNVKQFNKYISLL